MGNGLTLSISQLSCSVTSDSLRPHGLQHARLPCPSSPRVFSTHVPWDGDAIQPCHPLSPPSPPALYLSQHQGLFQGVTSSHQQAKILQFQLQHQSFQWIFRTNFFYDWLVWIACSPRDSRVFSNITVQKQKFFGAQLSLCSNSHIHTWLREKP